MTAAQLLSTQVDDTTDRLAPYHGAKRVIMGTTVRRGRYGSIKWKCGCCGTSGSVKGDRGMVRACLIAFVRRHLACWGGEDTIPP